MILMVKAIMGLKGEGKTKKLIAMVNKALEEERGDVVCIEKTANLTYDIPYQARLVKLSDYEGGTGYDFLRGVISGLIAGNHDITYIFMDSLFKLAGTESIVEAEKFLDWCDKFAHREDVKFAMTISADAATATDEMKKYF
jgi:hypothetical protein